MRSGLVDEHFEHVPLFHASAYRKKERKASTSVYESIRWLASKGKHSYVTQLRN